MLIFMEVIQMMIATGGQTWCFGELSGLTCAILISNSADINQEL